MSKDKPIIPDEEEEVLNESAATSSDYIPSETEEPAGEGETISLAGMFRDYWIDYASDVILDRSVPDIDDGLKPVQRRILHSMEEMDDGRMNKVQSIVGHTMMYHPHGDQSIKDALVNIGQKNLLVDCQGNWGNILTGEDAAAGRYIEARLSKFAKEVVFNKKTTHWKPSYDGRNQEPETLPVKFPLLLAQGTKGIAVTLTSVIMPYNFCELIEASIKILREEEFEIYPDFPTGGMIDVSKYNDGAQGGRLRIRAKMHYDEKRKAIVITEVPFTVTTGDLRESIIKAFEKGKIKIKKVEDYTASEAEVVVYLPGGVSPDQTIDALYAFTSCQISFSPQTCVIVDKKPVFTTASDILRHSTMRTRDLLRQELEIQLEELNERWYWVSLEKIFFEKGIYKKMEKKDSADWDEQVDEMHKAFGPYKKKLKRDVSRDDVLKLTEKPVKKISKFDIKKAQEEIEEIEMNIDEVNNHLAHLTDYAISYFKHILEKYGKGRERKTEIRNFEDIQAATVAVANEKLYVNRTTGFAGYGLKREEGVEFVCDCSNMDDIIVFRRDGSMMVSKVQDKVFVGSKDCTEIVFISVFRKRDERTVYNMVYRDGNAGYIFVKRFSVTGITRDKEYDLTKGSKNSKILYFTANPNGEAEVITVHHVSKPKLKKTSFDFDFATLAIKGRQAMGNILTRNAVRNINKVGEGVSTLGARKIWFDESVKRLNVTEAGRLLGEFKGADKIFTLMQSGSFRNTNFDLSNHFEDDLLEIRKYNRHNIVTVIYKEAEGGSYYVKRFSVEDASDKKLSFLEEGSGDEMLTYSMDTYPRLEMVYDEKSGKKVESEIVEVYDFIAVKGYKAKGKRLTTAEVKEFRWLDPLPEPEYEDEDEADNQPASDDNDRMGYAEGTQSELF
ncbi:MAG: DNA gyrase/topoisomerase IV subunit A [Bacteroidales bacterium]|nr:DNA gyrase/topoisomerase IV subunit A [Bacteroidales bacterium]MBQ6742792.1 DNA gyrase/topoisomerase IV subunit A [Bacteroidales bacterium]